MARRQKSDPLRYGVFLLVYAYNMDGLSCEKAPCLALIKAYVVIWNFLRAIPRFFKSVSILKLPTEFYFTPIVFIKAVRLPGGEGPRKYFP